MSNQQAILWQLIGETAAPPLQIRLDTMIFSLIIFGILLFVLAKYAWKPILEGLDNREKSIAKNIDDAKTSHEKAQALLAQYEHKLRAAGDEASRLVAEARIDAEKARERIVNEAKEEAHRQRDRAIAEINAARDAAVRELAEKSVDSAVMLASRIVGKSLKPDDHARLIEQSLERFSRN